MVVSDTNRFLFVAIPKIATSTIQYHLQSYGKVIKGDSNHLFVEQMIKHPEIGIDKWKEYYKICFIRNPWDWYVSLYLWVNNFNRTQGYQTFDDLHEYLIWNFSVNCGSTMANFVLNDNQKIDMDFVGRFELLERDFSRLCGRLNIPIPDIIQHRNLQNYSASRKHYTEYYVEQSLIDFVFEKEKLIIDIFGYKFGEDGRKTFDEGTHPDPILQNVACEYPDSLS